MRIVRTIGLAALAALALMAFAGSSPAFAVETTLCDTQVESPYCESGDRYPAKTVITGSASDFSINLHNYLEISCAESTFETETDAVSGEPLLASTPEFSFGGCKESIFGTKCTVASNESEAPAALAWTDHANGLVGAEGMGFEVGCSQFFGLHCDFELESGLTLSGGLLSELTADSIDLEKEKYILCTEEEAELSVTYNISSPKPLYVARAQAPPSPVTGLCKTFETYCEPGSLYAKGTQLKGTSSDATFHPSSESALGDLACEASSLNLETKADYGEPLSVDRNFVFGSCKLPAWGNAGCSMKPNVSGGGLSRIKTPITGKLIGKLEVMMYCPGIGVSCSFASAEGASMTFKGGYPEGVKPKVVVSALTLTASKPCFVTETLALSGTFTISTKEPVAVTNVIH